MHVCLFLNLAEIPCPGGTLETSPKSWTGAAVLLLIPDAFGFELFSSHYRLNLWAESEPSQIIGRALPNWAAAVTWVSAWSCGFCVGYLLYGFRLTPNPKICFILLYLLDHFHGLYRGIVSSAGVLASDLDTRSVLVIGVMRGVPHGFPSVLRY